MSEKKGVRAKGGKKDLSEIEVMSRIEKLLPGLSKAGLEFISAKIVEMHSAGLADEQEQ